MKTNLKSKKTNLAMPDVVPALVLRTMRTVIGSHLRHGRPFPMKAASIFGIEKLKSRCGSHHKALLLSKQALKSSSARIALRMGSRRGELQKMVMLAMGARNVTVMQWRNQTNRTCSGPGGESQQQIEIGKIQ
jgi:hypothetical protein